MASNEHFPKNTLHGLTPVRRRDCDKNTKARFEKEKEWTTARCHRLLRALTSRVAILTKDLELLSNTMGPHDAIHVDAKHTKSRRKTGYPHDDTDWNQGKKKVKRTYSSRLGQKVGSVAGPKTPRSKYYEGSKKSFVPGEIIIPTPILSRVRDTQFTASQDLSSLSVKAEANFFPKNSRASTLIRSLNDEGGDLSVTKSLSDLRKKLGTSRYSTYEGIYNGLSTLLNHTKPEKPCPKTGARSLMTMCLKAVPHYIDQERASMLAYEEETGTKSAINQRDMSMEIYDDLEQFGSYGRGWKPLRVIVRAHGIMVLRDAITAGLLDIQFCGILATLCVQNAANEEAESLLLSLICSSTFHAPKTLHDAAPSALKLLRNFVDGTGSYSFLYHQLAKLVTDDVLPLGWLATKDFHPIWTGVMQRLSASFMETGVIAFLEVVISSLAGACNLGGGLKGTLATAVESTYASLLTTLLSVTMLSKKHTSEQDTASQNIGGNDYKHIPSLLESSLAKHDFLCPEGNQSGLLVASVLFAKAQGDAVANSDMLNDVGLRPRLQALLDSDEEGDTIGEDLAAFICSVARCCGRGASETGFEYLKGLHVVLNYCICMDIVQGIIVDSAHAFARESPEREHLEYASHLEDKYSGRGYKALLDKSVKKPEHSGTGFRWEDGIGEWVTATPVVNKYNWSRKINIEPNTPLAAYVIQKPRQQCAFKSIRRTTFLNNTTPVAEVIVNSSSVDNFILESQASMNPEDIQRPLEEETANRETKALSLCEDEDVSLDDSFCSSVPSLIDDIGDASENSPSSRSGVRKRKLRTSNDEKSCKTKYTASLSGSTQSFEEDLILASQHLRAVIAPRLGHKLPRAGQAWQGTDDSEDELSFISTSANNDDSMRCSGVLTGRDRSQVKKRRKSKRQKSMSGCMSGSDMDMDSVDELCM
jgi:hypothetical protein